MKGCPVATDHGLKGHRSALDSGSYPLDHPLAAVNSFLLEDWQKRCSVDTTSPWNDKLLIPHISSDSVPNTPNEGLSPHDFNQDFGEEGTHEVSEGLSDRLAKMEEALSKIPVGVGDATLVMSSDTQQPLPLVVLQRANTMDLGDLNVDRGPFYTGLDATSHGILPGPDYDKKEFKLFTASSVNEESVVSVVFTCTAGDSGDDGDESESRGAGERIENYTCESCHDRNRSVQAFIFPFDPLRDFDGTIPKGVCSSCRTEDDNGDCAAVIPPSDTYETPETLDLVDYYSSFESMQEHGVAMCRVKRCAGSGPLVETEDDGSVNLCVRHWDIEKFRHRWGVTTQVLWTQIRDDTRDAGDLQSRMRAVTSHSLWEGYMARKDFGPSKGIAVTWEDKHVTEKAGPLRIAFSKERQTAFETHDSTTRWRCTCGYMSATWLCPSGTGTTPRTPFCRSHEDTRRVLDKCVTCPQKGTTTILTGGRCYDCYGASYMMPDARLTKEQVESDQVAAENSRERDKHWPSILTPWMVVYDLRKGASTSSTVPPR